MTRVSLYTSIVNSGLFKTLTASELNCCDEIGQCSAMGPWRRVCRDQLCVRCSEEPSCSPFGDPDFQRSSFGSLSGASEEASEALLTKLSINPTLLSGVDFLHLLPLEDMGYTKASIK